MDKIGANDPCPCGSGNKYKRCCRDAAVAPSYGPEDRGTAFAKLDAYIDKHLDEENEAAFDEFWSSVGGDDDELPRDFLPASNDAFDMWFVFDRQLADGRVPVEAFLGASRDLTPRERLFLQSLRHSTLRLYEIVDVVPGISLTLRDVLEGDRVTVSERRGSRTMTRHQRFAARVVSRGASGSPEIEAGLLHIPDLTAAAVETQLEAHRATFRREHPGAPAADFYRQMPPFFRGAASRAIRSRPSTCRDR